MKVELIDQSLKIINMANIKRSVLNLIGLIFTIFLAFKYVASLFFVYSLRKLPLKVCENLKRISYGVC